MIFVFYVVNNVGHSMTHMWHSPMQKKAWDRSDSCFMIPPYTWDVDDPYGIR